MSKIIVAFVSIVSILLFSQFDGNDADEISVFFNIEDGMRNEDTETLMSADSAISCSNQCLKYPYCTSFNFDTTLKICELSTSYDLEERLVTGADIQKNISSSWKLGYLNLADDNCNQLPQIEDRCLLTPCWSNTTASCTPQKCNRGYECNCLPGAKGKRCEEEMDHNFNVQDTAIHTWGNPISYTFLVLKVTVPSHGESKNENWCRDYQRLCESYGRRPTGCAGSRIYDDGFVQCGELYNSKMDLNDDNGVSNYGLLNCDPSYAISEIANAAFGGNDAERAVNAFGFHNCKSDCRKERYFTTNALYILADHTRSSYTVCI